MAQQVPADPSSVVDDIAEHNTREVASDLASKRLAIVNAILVGPKGAGGGDWVLVDTGVMGTTGVLLGTVEARFGPGARPAAIVMTHGHFDHVGGLEQLAAQWDVPVYAHPLEHPYLDGTRSYQPPDPSVGGGLMARIASLYPRGPVNVGRWLRALPEDGSIPLMPGWRWLHTPGHTEGHVSFWRETDRSLIAGDAFITTAQESAYAVAVQAPELHGPPMYFTPDWSAARQSVEL
ncbi:MAG: MBL fold metallo-hydrolase, partial [Rhodospirillales bacterium]|nr:MBL fold metallo-hydrolase [Rhodospirillales bacterium]